MAIVDATIALEEFLKGDLVVTKDIVEHTLRVVPLDGSAIYVEFGDPEKYYRWDEAARIALQPTLASLESALGDVGLPLRSLRSIYLDVARAGPSAPRLSMAGAGTGQRAWSDVSHPGAQP